MHPDVEKYLPLLAGISYEGWGKLATAVEIEFNERRKEHEQALQLPNADVIRLRQVEIDEG
jgi:hypothetical protein